MAQPILTVDTPQRLELRAPRLGPMWLTLALMALIVGVGGLFPSYRVAPFVFGVAALWAASGMLRVHDLVLDLDARTWRWRHGWLPRPTTRGGTFEDLAEVAIEPNQAIDGLVKSRLRSRVVTLVFEPSAFGAEDRSRDPDDQTGVFLLGFPMGPQAARAEAARYAERLGVAAVDYTLGDGHEEATNPSSPARP